MAAGRIVVPPYFPARDRDFNLLAGALLYVYDNETTAKAAIYTNEGLTVLSSNPVVANSSGQFPAIFAEAGTEADPVLYSIAVTTSTGASPGNPFVFDNYRPSVDWETAASALAEAAAAAAAADAVQTAADAVQTAADLAAIEAIIADAPDAPSVLNKLNRDGDNASAGLLANIGEQYPDLSAMSAPIVNSDVLAGYRSGLKRFTASVFADYIKAFFSASGGSALVGFISALTGAVARTAQNKMRDILDVRDLGIIADVTDGSRTGTDQTSALVAKLTALGVAGFRGFINIPYGTRFTVSTVYAAVPVGVTLLDDSSINWGRPLGYMNKFRITYSSDAAADDSATQIASSRHASLFLTNFGTGGGAEATERFGSILHSAGIDQDADNITGTQLLFSKANGQDRWATRLKLYTPYDIAIANPYDWVTATVYAAGAMCRSDGGKIYRTVAGGTSGATAPTGTGTISDGGVTWVYRAAGFTVDAVYLDVTDNGNIIQASPLNETIRHTLSTNGNGAYSEFDPALSRFTLYHISLGSAIYEVDNGFGLRPAISFSERRLAVTGATPGAPGTGAGVVTNAGATNMTEMIPVSGRTQATVSLRFDDANTTVVHGAGSNQFRLKGGVNATPPAQGYMTFEMDTFGFGGVWLEVSRSF